MTTTKIQRSYQQSPPHFLAKSDLAFASTTLFTQAVTWAFIRSNHQGDHDIAAGKAMVQYQRLYSFPKPLTESNVLVVGFSPRTKRNALKFENNGLRVLFMGDRMHMVGLRHLIKQILIQFGKIVSPASDTILPNCINNYLFN